MASGEVNRNGPAEVAPTDGRAANADRIAQLETQLETYKTTLTGIYDLYDKKIEELSLIRRISDSLRNPLDLEGLCQETLEAVAHEIALDRLALILVDPDRQRLRIKASFDAAQDESRFFQDHEARVLPLDRGPAGESIRSGLPILQPSVTPALDPLGDDSGEPGSLMVLPLVSGSRAVGVLALSRVASQPFGQDDLRVLTIISDHAATALANVQLFNELAAANIRLKESEREARQTSVYLESMLEAANDVIFTLTPQGRIRYVNQKVAEWGYSKEGLVNRPISDLFVNAMEASDLLGQMMRAGRQVVEVGMKTATGLRRDVLLSTSFLPEDGDRPASCLVLARDITERKQLEKQLFHSEKLASIGILAAGVAHEIGNPLSAISGYTQILQGGGIEEAEVQEYLQAIASQNARIERIIQDLLHYSRPSAGHNSDIDLSEALPSILAMLAAQKSFRNLEVQFDFGPEPPKVHMDRDHLAQIVINIALNAAQAMPDGGRLTVSAERQGARAIIQLADSGPGIPPEILNSIFDPFFTTKSVGQGTGLGLAICHRIAESYNGTITAYSEAGAGATFILNLPAASVERA